MSLGAEPPSKANSTVFLILSGMEDKAGSACLRKLRCGDVKTTPVFVRRSPRAILYPPRFLHEVDQGQGGSVHRRACAPFLALESSAPYVLALVDLEEKGSNDMQYAL